MKRFSFFLAVMAVLQSCTPPQESEIKLSREARAVLGSPRDIDVDALRSLDEVQLQNDMLAQRNFSWRFWDELFARKDQFSNWQTWYAKEDLERIFRHLYEGIGVEGRKARRAFSENEIDAALQWNDSLQFLEPSWNKARFDLWLAQYDDAEKQQAIPGINKIMFNPIAIRFLLANYARIFHCHRGKDCAPLRFPLGAVFLKFAWRRGDGDFTLPAFDTSSVGLSQQMAAEAWTPMARWVPAASESFRMTTASGQIFHLAGMHAEVRLQSAWLFQSMWISPEKNRPFGFDRPASMQGAWERYESCSSMNFSKLSVTAEIDQGLSELLHPWCSNPYLESGTHNQRTHCVGCHQHAGSDWAETDFKAKLLADELHAPGSGLAHLSDGVWSLYNGPDPYAGFFAADIDYFDVYDFHEP